MPVIFKQIGITPSNKTQKYSLQLTARAYGYKGSKGNTVDVLYPIIDKLSVTVPVEDEYRGAIDEIIMDAHKIDKAFTSVSANNKLYKCNTKWTDEKSGGHVLIQSNPKTGKNYLRFELNPHRLGPDCMSRFKELLETDITLGNVSYAKALETGRITRADITVDMINITHPELINVGKKKGKTILYLGLEAQEVETTYLDKPKSKASHKIVYNKLQEQIDKGNDPTYEGVIHTRVEYQHKGAPFKNLHNIHNPFKKLQVINPIYKPEAIEDWVWQLFLNSCRFKGINTSIDLPAPKTPEPLSAGVR